MIRELTIKNFAIIDELRLTFGPGFNVLTGETGAGKSIIVDAVGMLLGGRADSVFIRSGCDTALVEGIFKLVGESGNEIRTLLNEEGLDHGVADSDLTLGRELRSSGRNICRVNGRMVNLVVLRTIAGRLVDVHGQSDHLSLLHVREHLKLLDRFGGLEDNRDELGAEVRELNSVRAQLSDLRSRERELAQRVDLLRFNLNEIDVVAILPGEEDVLEEELTRLANAEKLVELTEMALRLVGEGDLADGPPAAGDLLGQLAQSLERLERIDVGLHEQHVLAQSLLEQLRDLTGDLVAYRDRIEFNPIRLIEVEARLSLIKELTRKYGPDVTDVLEYAKSARSELENITGLDARINDLVTRELALLESVGNVGVALSLKRREVSGKLAKLVMASMSDLNMDGARFSVDIDWRDDSEGVLVQDGRRVGVDVSGLDRVEFLVAPNPGEGLQPIAKIASGGETSRLMLALRDVLSQADHKPTLIFDEIDQGVGGRLGAIIGRKLWGLTASHQVLCITHLPQLAGYGDIHFKVAKEMRGNRTLTRVFVVEGADRVEELSQMVGSPGEAMRESVTSLLATAEREKETSAIR